MSALTAGVPFDLSVDDEESAGDGGLSIDGKVVAGADLLACDAEEDTGAGVLIYIKNGRFLICL